MLALDEGVLSVVGPFTPLDTAICIFLLIMAGLGFWTGFVRQVLLVICLLVSLWFAWAYHVQVATALDAQPSLDMLGLSAGLCFGGALAVCYLLSYLFRKPLDASKPTMLDRVFGAVFGSMAGALAVGALAFMVLQYSEEGSPWRRYVTQSYGAVAMAACAETFLKVLPESVRRTPAEQQAASECMPPLSQPLADCLVERQDLAGRGLSRFARARGASTPVVLPGVTV